MARDMNKLTTDMMTLDYHHDGREAKDNVQKDGKMKNCRPGEQHAEPARLIFLPVHEQREHQADEAQHQHGLDTGRSLQRRHQPRGRVRAKSQLNSAYNEVGSVL